MILPLELWKKYSSYKNPHTTLDPIQATLCNGKSKPQAMVFNR